MKQQHALQWLRRSIGAALLSMSASSAYAAQCEYTVDNEWNNGFVAQISITNDGNTAIDDWEISWNYSGDNRISSIWNATIAGTNPYSAEGLSWNSSIAPGATAEFGISGTKGAEAAEVPDILGDICVPANQAPIAVATSDITSGDAPLSVMFDATGSSDPDGPDGNLTYSWNFGDGTTASGDMVSHTYNSAGIYLATVTVSDGEKESSASISITAVGNEAPIASASASPVSGSAPLDVDFDASQSSDPDNGPDNLSYSWDFGDGTSGTGVSPSHTYTENGSYQATLTVTDGELSSTTIVSIFVGDVAERVDNPFVGVKYYVDPIWSAKAAAEPNGDLISGYNTAVWMDRIGAITDGIGLRGHLDEALEQNAGMFMFVVYDLPNRDCAALASNGELRIDENGFQRYQDEYIAPIVEIVSDPKYSNIRIVAIIEVDSLPNLVTNLSESDCSQADGPGGYRDGITYALNQLSQIDNIYSYVDIAHSGWLGWSDNFAAGSRLIADVIKGTDKGWDSINGFISNSANYTPVVEPFMPDANLAFAGFPIRSADFYEWNDYLEEKAYVQDWRLAMIELGAPESLGMLIDTARNGWGGAERPTQVSSATDIDTFVNESRVDRRLHRGNWCNQPGGIGFKPWAAPYEGIDAFVWVKPPGESDGISDPDFEPDPNDPAKQHDPMCDPNAPNRYNNAVGTGGMENAPHAGRWFPEQFAVLIDKAYPAASDPAGPPPPPPPPRDDCPGIDPLQPVVIAAKGTQVEIDLGCEAAIHVEFPNPIEQNLYVENNGGEFDVLVEHAGGSYVAQGHFVSQSLAGVTSVKVTRIDAATSIKLRFD
ncbi:glycoside hydrolase family 6 protein [Echinimonas agarilytica]|uniref:Glucanase n=1 Tax=Echinimonas agarilytica TaxID=1215918 RepID=A0AA41W5R1_9GAMM|nr:glycoside hydrolase family 6 protein [Echinimonas agarilytica]MCM2679205.1 glycoside hydrolase family 6 protein [Echinimonas agarilytica]